MISRNTQYNGDNEDIDLQDEFFVAVWGHGLTVGVSQIHHVGIDFIGDSIRPLVRTTKYDQDGMNKDIDLVELVLR